MAILVCSSSRHTRDTLKVGWLSREPMWEATIRFHHKITGTQHAVLLILSSSTRSAAPSYSRSVISCYHAIMPSCMDAYASDMILAYLGGN
ncbi:hypothetical protein AMATHDRAFT_67958, partial [Amanita thiersii Skay4041]